MTDLEQSVVDALTGIPLEGTILGGRITLGKQVAREIAPRVAAAIRAAWQTFPWELARQAGMSVGYEDQSARERCEAAALDALRGARRAPAETPE